MNIKGFSLIELMVVIAIVAIIAAVALPLYNERVYMAKISKALPYIEDFKKQMINNYNKKGTFAAPINVNGTIASSGAVNVYYPAGTPISAFHWHFPTDNPDGSSVSVFFVSISGLSGIDPLYQEPTFANGYAGPKSLITYYILAKDGMVTTYCGTFGTAAGQDIPDHYMKKLGCKCTGLAWSISSGTPTCS